MEKGIISNKTEKGYCFIRSSSGESIFVHVNNVDRLVYEKLAKGSKVLFDYEETDRGKSATNIMLESPASPHGKIIDFSEQQIRELFGDLAAEDEEKERFKFIFHKNGCI